MGASVPKLSDYTDQLHKAIGSNIPTLSEDVKNVENIFSGMPTLKETSDYIHGAVGSKIPTLSKAVGDDARAESIRQQTSMLQKQIDTMLENFKSSPASIGGSSTGLATYPSAFQYDPTNFSIAKILNPYSYNPVGEGGGGGSLNEMQQGAFNRTLSGILGGR